MDRADLIRRLKAARALGGFASPQALADDAVMVENGIKESRIRELESMKGRAHARPMELAIIARACSLPEEFFSEPFERMETPSQGERLATLERAVTMLASALADVGGAIGAGDPLEQESRAAGRAISGAAADLLDTYARDDAAAGRTRDEGDASQEAPPARRAGTQSGE
jgi:hypothetical protein